MASIQFPSEFFSTVVLPNCEEFVAMPHDLRLAMNAAIAVFNMRDWMNEYRKAHVPGWHGDEEKYQASLERKCPQFRILRDVANASKHMMLRRGRHSRPLLSGASDLCEDSVRVGDSVGYSLSLVRVNLTNGKSEILQWVLECSIVLWCRELGLTEAKTEITLRRLS
jgi:hypothetical protein